MGSLKEIGTLGKDELETLTSSIDETERGKRGRRGERGGGRREGRKEVSAIPASPVSLPLTLGSPAAV